MADALDGTVALVTGASSGIGEAASRALAARGAAVALVARRRDRLEKLAAQFEERGGSALVIPADVEVPDQAEAAVQRTVDEMGRLDTLVLGVRAFSEALRQEVTGPRHVAVNELLVRPTEQDG